MLVARTMLATVLCGLLFLGCAHVDIPSVQGYRPIIMDPEHTPQPMLDRDYAYFWEKDAERFVFFPVGAPGPWYELHEQSSNVTEMTLEEQESFFQRNSNELARYGFVPPHDVQRVEQFRKAAELGDAEAQNNLGVMYAEGRGVPQDDARAVEWYRKAAEQGHATAQFNLGASYAVGRGVPQDDVQAVEWYRKAAEQGDATAQRNLGLRYTQGRGVPQDDVQAVEWFRKAAEQGLAEAQYSLGLMYADGQGVPEDDAQAIKWFRKAAEQGHQRATEALAGMEN